MNIATDVVLRVSTINALGHRQIAIDHKRVFMHIGLPIILSPTLSHGNVVTSRESRQSSVNKASQISMRINA